MENTKDLVRAERGSCFVRQVGGTPAAPCPQGPVQPPAPLPGLPLLSHAPSTSGAPLPLPAVKRWGVSPPPTPLSPGLFRLLPVPFTSWKTNFRRKFFSSAHPTPPPLALAGGERLDLRLPFLAAQGRREESSRLPRGRVWVLCVGRRLRAVGQAPRGVSHVEVEKLKRGGVGTCGRERWEWCLGSSRL